MTDDVYVGEARLLRSRLEQLQDRLFRRLDGRPATTGRTVGRVYSQGAIPTSGGKFYAVHPVTVLGPEVEGGTPVLTVDTSRSFLVDLLGGTAVAGDDLVCRRVDHRWVARAGGSTPVVLPVCGKIGVTVNGCNNRPVAAATVDLYRQRVTSIAVPNGGSGYTSPPLVSFATTNGFGGVATAVLSGSVVDHIDVVNGGVYTIAPVLSLSGGGGTGATATATLGAQALVESIPTNLSLGLITFVNHGTNYTTIPNVTVSGGGGTGAVVTANLSAVAVSTVALDTGGSGYTTLPFVSVAGGAGSGASISARLTAGPVTSLRLQGGSGYANGTGYAIHFVGGGGTGAAGRFDVIGGAVCNLVLTSGGTGYTSAPSINFTAGGGSNAGGISTFNAGTGAVTGVFVESGSFYTPGTGYALGISGGVGGSGAAGTFDVDSFGSVVNLVLTSGGSGYTTNPTITFPGAGSGTGAVATALLGPTSLGSLVRNVGGSGYTSTPTLTIDPPTSGTTATGHVTLASQNVASLTVVNVGRDYTTAPTITIDPPASGTQATVTAALATGEQSVFYTTEIGKYTIKVTAPALAWWDASVLTSTATVPTCVANASVTVALIPATGYSCKCIQCRDPSPDTCTITDPNGSHTATWSGSTGGYKCCYVKSGQTVYDYNNAGGFCQLPTSPGSVAVGYSLLCPTGATLFRLGVNYTACDLSHLLPGTCSGDVAVSTLASVGGISNVATIGASGGGAPNLCNTSVSFNVTSSFVNGTVAVSFP